MMIKLKAFNLELSYAFAWISTTIFQNESHRFVKEFLREIVRNFQAVSKSRGHFISPI